MYMYVTYSVSVASPRAATVVTYRTTVVTHEARADRRHWHEWNEAPSWYRIDRARAARLSYYKGRNDAATTHGTDAVTYDATRTGGGAAAQPCCRF